jgi:hypothetical protein
MRCVRLQNGTLIIGDEVDVEVADDRTIYLAVEEDESVEIERFHVDKVINNLDSSWIDVLESLR